MSATRKGQALALLLHRMGGGKAWEEDAICSVLMRQAARFETLSEEECSGPRWSWTYQGDWTQVVSVETFTEQNERALDRCGRRIVATVSNLAPTEHGAITVVLGGDPRGYVVRLMVPTGADERTEVGLSRDGAHVSTRHKVAAQ